MKRKYLALLLSIVLTLSLIPTSVFAAASANIGDNVAAIEISATEPDAKGGIEVVLSVTPSENKYLTGYSFAIQYDPDMVVPDMDAEGAIYKTVRGETTYYGVSLSGITNTTNFKTNVFEDNERSIFLAADVDQDGLYQEVEPFSVTYYFEQTETAKMSGGKAEFTLLTGDASGTTLFEVTVYGEEHGIVKLNDTVSTVLTFPVKNVVLTGGVTAPTKNGSDESHLAGTNVDARVTWEPALVGGKFAAGTDYTATVTVTPIDGCVFADDCNVTLDGFTFSRSGDSYVATKTFKKTAEKELTGLTIKTNPTKMSYVDGDTLDTTGLVLTATYDDGSVKDITSGFTVTGTLSRNQTEATVSYGGKTVTISGLTVDRAAAIAKSVTVSGGSANVMVPADKSVDSKSEAFTVAVTDQYEETINSPTVEWSIKTKDGDNTVNGVSIENGVVTVTNTAKGAITDTEGVKFIVTAKCGEVTDTKEITIKRDAQHPTTIDIGGGSDIILVPADGADDNKSEAFTATVKDQYGHTIENASVTWSAVKGGPWGSKVSGVSMTEDGCVTVSSAAAKEILNTKDVTLTAVAKFGDDVYGYVYGYKNFTVARAASVVKSISITSASDTVEIPGSVSYDFNGNFSGPEKDNTVSFTVTVKDQYNTEIKDPDVSWSIAPEISGVEIAENGILTVKSNAADTIKSTDGQVFTITAASTANPEAKGTVNITVQRAESTLLGFNVLKDGVKLTGNDTIVIDPNKDIEVTYTAQGYDQYGAEKDAVCDSIILYDKDNKTVSSDGKLTVSKDATPADYKLVITKSDLKTIERTISVVNKKDPGLTITGKNEATYGDVFKLTASVSQYAGQGSWKIEFSETGILNANQDGGKVTLTACKVGTTTITMTYEDDEYYGKKTFDVTVTPKEVTVGQESFKVSKVYDGTMAAGTGSGTLAVNGILDKDTGVSVTSTIPDYTDANVGGQAKLTLGLALTGEGKDNYKLKNDTVEVPCEITPATLTIASATATNRDYEKGKTDVSISNITFANASNPAVLPSADDYTATGAMTNADAGMKDVTVTVTLTGQAARNYTLTNNTCQTTVKINKINWTGADTGSMKVKYGSTATLDLKTIGLPDGYQFGSIDYSKTDGYGIIDSAALNGDILSVTLVDKSGYISKKAQVSVRGINSTNYNEYVIIVDVEMIDKSAQTIEADDVTMTYGNSAQVNVKNASALHGAVSYSVTSGSDVISVDLSGKITALKSGTATVEISAAGDSDYAAATKSITVNIAKRTLTVKAADKNAYVGEKQPELTYEVSGLVGSDKLTKEPTLKLVHEADVDPMKKAGTYVITFETLPVASANYDLTTENGTLTVRTRHSSGTTGSTGGVSIDRPENGKVTVSPANPTKGSTVTITVTPNKDQELKSLEVIDQHGNSLSLTDLGNGKFSFVMPEGKVTIKSEFGEANAFVNPYDDVKPGDWYYSAVEYVTVNGLMNGTGKGFEPNLATSRAMIWTILARMSGVNTASSSEWYAVAQQWAIVNGVSDGTMPNGTITREQLAAMLYRYAVSNGMVKGPATTDLSVFADANSVSSYAVEAMQWAVSTGLISGMDSKLNPQGSATRAQVATMLMRFAELAK